MTDAKDIPPPRRRLLVPAILTLLLAALLHLLVIHWGSGYLNQSTANQVEASTVSVTLQPLPLPQQPVSLPLAARQKPKPVKARPPKPSPPQTTIVAVADNVATTNTTIADEPAVDPSPAAAAPPEPTTPPTEAVTEPVAPVASGTHYQLDAPPSAALSFDVHAFSDNLDWYGNSTLTWKTDGTHYSVDGEVYARFIAKVTFLTFTSSGDINEFGIAPELYTEKKRNRSSTNTHFNRERNLVSFSASTQTYPRVGGEQDRASLIWQLAAIGRGDSDKFAAGNVIDLFVAGVRDGEIWRMQVVGQEDISLASGHIQAWHVVRQPRPGSYEQRLDIWLAPGQQWYPVRLRFTETNGDYLQMSLSNLKTL